MTLDIDNIKAKQMVRKSKRGRAMAIQLCIIVSRIVNPESPQAAAICCPAPHIPPLSLISQQISQGNVHKSQLGSRRMILLWAIHRGVAGALSKSQTTDCCMGKVRERGKMWMHIARGEQWIFFFEGSSCGAQRQLNPKLQLSLRLAFVWHFLRYVLLSFFLWPKVNCIRGSKKKCFIFLTKLSKCCST